MSFERFSTSDIYIFEHVGGWIECCGCWLSADTDDSWFVELDTPREALDHLSKHQFAGHDIGHARKRILEEYPDLDIRIEPYKQHPPQGFRDKSNGE